MLGRAVAMLIAFSLVSCTAHEPKLNMDAEYVAENGAKLIFKKNRFINELGLSEWSQERSLPLAKNDCGLEYICISADNTLFINFSRCDQIPPFFENYKIDIRCAGNLIKVFVSVKINSSNGFDFIYYKYEIEKNRGITKYTYLGPGKNLNDHGMEYKLTSARGLFASD